MTASSYAAWNKYFGEDFGAEGHGHARPFTLFDRGDDVDSLIDIDVVAENDLDIENDVEIAQLTEVNVEVDLGSALILDEAGNMAPQQSGAIGNFDGAVATGGVAVDAGAGAFGGPGFFGFGGNTVNAFTDIDVVNVTDIDIANNVTAIQNTVIDIDIGAGSSAILSEALNAAPSQNLAVGNFGGFVETGAVGVEAEDFVA